jgi:hypothetical protein
MSEPLLIQYANIIHRYGVNSEEALAFLDKYSDDAVFMKRAGVLNILHKTVDGPEGQR